MSFGILILRLAVGLTLAAHGAQKLFGWFGGYGLTGTGAFLEQLGFRPGRVQAAAAGSVEFLGGLLLAAGLLTPLASAGVIAVMLVAAVSVHVKSGFFAQAGGYEYAFILGATAAALAFTGPGALSLDGVLGTSVSGGPAGFAALAAGLVGGALPLLSRRPNVAAAAAERHAA